MSTAGVVAVQSNPFPGLRPFHENEEHLFFGRESQVDAMVDTLAASRFLAVVGTSGSGKSSLVNCGLRPALRGGLMARAGTAWRMAQFRPGSDPLQAMARALAEDDVLFRDHQAGGLALDEIIETTLRMSKLGLIDIYEQAQLDEDVNLLVVVDQFEELFRYARLGDQQETVHGVSEEAVAFVNLLLAAKDQATCPIYVVLTMRSDFLGDCAQFPGLAEAINAGQYLVPRMTRDERRAAINGPVGVGGAEMSPVLLTRLVNDVGNNPDQLSILQHALNRTWARWENQDGREGPLDLAHYQAIGTMAHALDQHAERAYAELASERQRQICEKLFKALTDKATDPRGVRRPTTLGTVCALAEATEAEVTEVIDVFRKPSRSFLMPPAGEALEAETVIDISHESLMRVWQRLNAWADEEARSAQIYRRLAETSVLHRDGNALLFQDPELQLALGWRERNQPNDVWARRYYPEFETAMRFLDASVAERERLKKEEEAERQQELTLARKRVRQGIAVSAFSLLLMLLASYGLYRAQQEKEKAISAEKQAYTLAEKADLREKAALVKALLPKEPLRALVLAIQAAGENQSELGEFLPSVEASLLSATHVAEWSHVFTANEAAVISVAISSDGETIVSGSDDGSVRLWDREGKPIGKPLAGHEDWVRSVAIAPDGETIVSGSDDGTVRLWDGEGKPIGEPLTGHEDWVRSVAISPDGETIVSGSDDMMVVLWDRQGKPIEKLTGHEAAVRSVAISPDGRTIVSGSDDRTVRLWDREGKPIGKPLRGHEALVTSVAISPDGETIVSGSDDGTVRLWNRAGPIGEPLTGHEARVTSVEIAPDGETIVSGSDDGSVRLWNGAGKPIGQPKWHEHEIGSLAISGSEGKTIVSSSGDSLWLWTLEKNTAGKPLASYARGEVGQGTLASIAISPDGKTIVSGSDDGSVRLWDHEGKRLWDREVTPIGKPLKGNEDSDNQVTPVAISSDGKTIVSGSDDGSVRLWDREGKPIGKPVPGHEDWVRSVAITPDGKTIVSGSDDWTVRLWDRQGKPIGKPLTGHAGWVRSVAITPDGKTIVSGSDDGTVRLWDRQGKPMGKPLKGHTTGVTSVAVAPDGKTIVSSNDNGVRLWDLEDAGGGSKPLRPRDKTVTSVAFSPNGKYIVSASADMTVRLWDRNGNSMGNPFKPLEGKTDVVIVAFSDDSRDVVTVSRDNRKVWLWRVGEPKSWLELACEKVRHHVVLVQPYTHAAEICLDSGGWSDDDRAEFLMELAAPAKIREGSQLAQEGDVEGATVAFRKALEFDPDAFREAALELDLEIDLEGDPETLDQGLEAVARKLAAPAKIWEGGQLAQEGDIEGAIAAFRKALALDPDAFREAALELDLEIDLDGDPETLDQGPEAVARNLAASAKVWEAYELAEEGDVEKATAAFRKALALDPAAFREAALELDLEIDLDGDLEALDQGLEAVARKLAAPARLWEGFELAQGGDVEGAIAVFKEALASDPAAFQQAALEISLEIDLDGDPEAVARNLAASAKVWEGHERAQEGDVDGAIVAFRAALELDPRVDLDPDTTAIEQDPEAVAKAWEGRGLAQEKVWEGDQLAEEGDIEKALQAYAEAEELDPSLATDASFWNNVGWVGSLGGNAANALIASEKAVALATEDHVGDCRDTRGLARALTGDTQGAIEDFEAFIGSDPLPELKAQRQQWVDALRGGEEPFTPQLLAELRNQ